MAMTSAVCAACAAPVPYGRLSCPACGELLASVNGRARQAPIEATPEPMFLDPAGAATTDEAVPEPMFGDGLDELSPRASVAAAEVVPVPDGGDLMDLARDPEPVEPSAAVTATAAGTRVDDGPMDVADADDAIDDVFGTEDVVEADDERDLLDRDDAGTPGGSSSPDRVTPAWPPEGTTRAPGWPTRPAPVVATGSIPTFTPGAYVPPAAYPDPAGTIQARVWTGPGRLSVAAPAASEAVAVGAVVAPPGADRSSLTVSNPIDRFDPARVAEFVDWLAVAGAALAVLGFVLPWSVTVIGSPGLEYIDRWGLAGPGHLLVALGLAAVLALAILRNPIPAWIRTGIAGLMLGSFMIGLVWPYVVGPLGAMPGAIVTLIGAVLLLVAAIVALAAGRHGDAPVDV